MREQLHLLKEKAEKEILQCTSLNDLNDFRIKYLGEKG